MRIAVVGAGISGLGAAWLLSRRHDVHLFEQEARAGGHSNTVVAPSGQPVDTGFIVYNEKNYPSLTALFRTLGVATGPALMSFGVSIGGGRYEYAGDSNVLRMFAQRRNWLSWRHHRMWIEILRFNRATLRGLRAGTLPDVSLGEYLDRGGYGHEFRARYLLPMAGAIWSCSTRAALAFALPEFARFFDAHGLLDVLDGPPWRYVHGGSRAYVDRLVADFRGTRRLGTPVTRVERGADGARVATASGTEAFDAVVLATHADQSLRLLGDADAAERDVLGAIPYAANEAVLHTDESLLPSRRRAWCAWNYLADEDAIDDRRVGVSYWMNVLQQIPGRTNYVVTLNPPRQPDPAKVLYRATYAHPVFSRAAVAAQARLPALQGRRHTYFCGAWTGYGFHEDGLRSGVAVASALGCPAPWTAAAPAPSATAPALEPAVEPA